MYLGLYILQQLTPHTIDIPKMIHHMEQHTIMSKHSQSCRMICRQMLVEPFRKCMSPQQDHASFYMRACQFELTGRGFEVTQGGFVVFSDICIFR